MILKKTISIARPFSSIAASPKAPTVGVLFAGGGHAASLPTGIVGKGRKQDAEASHLALNKNGHTLNTAFLSIMGIIFPEQL